MWKRNREYFIFAGLWAFGTLCLYSAVALVRTAGRSPSPPLTTLIELLLSGVVLLVIGLAAFIVALVINFRSIYQVVKKRREEKQSREAKAMEKLRHQSQEGVWPPAPAQMSILGSQISDEDRDDKPRDDDNPTAKKTPYFILIGLSIVAFGCLYIAIPLLIAAHRGMGASATITLTEEIVVGVIHLVIGLLTLIMTLVLFLRNVVSALKMRRIQNQSQTEKQETGN